MLNHPCTDKKILQPNGNCRINYEHTSPSRLKFFCLFLRTALQFLCFTMTGDRLETGDTYGCVIYAKEKKTMSIIMTSFFHC